MALKIFAKDQIVMDSSLSSFNLYLIQSGEVGCYVDEKSLQMKLKSGQSFGELAYTFNRASKTSYKCLETCQIWVVQRQDIPSILKDFERQHQARMTAPIFKSSSFFDDWDLGSISYLYYYGKILNYVRNQTVYLQNTPSDGIYLIVSGEFSYSIKQKSDKKNLQINEDGEINQDDERISLEKEIYLLRNHNISKTFVSKISTMSAGQMFGEEILKKQDRNFDATCESVEGTVIFFSGSVFWSLIYSNPSSKIIFDEKLKKQDFIQKRQINYIKSSMDDYDHYLLGKQYAHAEKNENENDSENSNGSQKRLFQQNVSKKVSSEREKKNQQIKDEIKNAIEKIPILDLKKINDQAKQFNQYSFDPKEEKFFNPNQQEQNEIESGSLTNRNIFKMQMRTNSTINNQYQLEFLKIQLPINFQNRSHSARNTKSNFSNSYSSAPLNTLGQNTPLRSKVGRNSQEEQEKLEITPIIQNHASQIAQEGEILITNNKMHLNTINNNTDPNKTKQINSLNLPLSCINIHNSINTPINQNQNNQTPIQQATSNHTPRSSNPYTNSNVSNELFELILQNNSKNFGKQYIRMKKFIQEGDKINTSNRKKYSLQNIFGSERSTPRSLINQITNILKEKSNSISLPFSPITEHQQQQQQMNDEEIFNTSKDYQNLLTNQDQTFTNQVDPAKIICTQDEYITTSRKQSYIYLTHQQSNSTPSNKRKYDTSESPNNPSNQSRQVTTQQLKQLHMSSFAHAVMQHSVSTTQNFMSQINHQHYKIDSPSTSTPHSKKQMSLEDQIDNLNTSDKRNSFLNQKQVIKIPNLQLHLGSQTQRDSNAENIHNFNRNGVINEGVLSTEKEKSQQKDLEGKTKTERTYLSKTSHLGVRVSKYQPKKDQISNRIIQGSISKSQDELFNECSNIDTQTSNLYSLTSRYSKDQNNLSNTVPFIFTNKKSSSFHQKEQNTIANKDISQKQELTNQSQFQNKDDKNNKTTPQQSYKHQKECCKNQIYQVPSQLIEKDKQQNQNQKFIGQNVKEQKSQPSLAQIPLTIFSNQFQSVNKFTQENLTKERLEQKNQREQNTNAHGAHGLPSDQNVFNQISFQGLKSKRIRLKSDIPLQKRQLDDDYTQYRNSSSENQKIIHQTQVSQSSLNNTVLNNQKLVLNQTRPLYHDSNCLDDNKRKYQKQQSKSITNLKEQLLQKHIIAKFHIQEPQKIKTFLENIADSQKNKKQKLPQQFVFSYAPNQSLSLLNNQCQIIQNTPVLQMLQSTKNRIDENIKIPVQDKHFLSSKHQKRYSQNFETLHDQVLKRNSDKGAKESSSFSNDYQICEDLGYNFVKKKQQ